MKLVPDMMPAEVRKTLDTFEGKLDRIIGLLEMLLAVHLHNEGMTAEEIADMITR